MREDYNRYTFEPKKDDQDSKRMEILYYNPKYVNDFKHNRIYPSIYEIKSDYNLIKIDNVYHLCILDDNYNADEVLEIAVAFKDQYGQDIAVSMFKTRKKKEFDYV